MTSSVFVHDIQAPAPLEEFFLPLRDEVRGAPGLCSGFGVAITVSSRCL